MRAYFVSTQNPRAMSNTYTQLYIQFVFAVKHRHGLIEPSWKERLYQYCTGIVQERGHKMIRINGMPDHLHVFIGLNPKESISTLMQNLKGDSSLWINEQGFCRGHLEWQSGYGAFSYGRSQVDDVVKYIINQEEHHCTKTFLEEYTALLRAFEVEYEEEYLFHPVLP